MADYIFEYMIPGPPQPTNDGSCCVLHDVYVVARDVADPEAPFVIVGGRHKSIAIPADALANVLKLPHGSSKISAYKNLLVNNRDNQPIPIQGWGLDDLEAFMDANDLASEVATNADTYITDHWEYPIQFSL